MVIQRWQSLLLLAAAVIMGCFTFLPIAQINTADYTYCLSSVGFAVESESPNGSAVGVAAYTWYFFAISLMSVLLIFINIFLFSNLKRQKRMCLISALFIIAAFATEISLALNTFDNYEISWNFMMFSPLAAMLAVIVAYWLISKDDKTLRAVDRIR